MEKTHLDYFNYYLIQFANELVSQFPETKKPLLEVYRPLLEGDKKNDIYSKYFIARVNSHLAKIGAKDVSLFEEEGQLFLLEGVDFNEIWKTATPDNKQAIWKYLQLLSVLGRKVIPSKNEILELLCQVGGVINTPDPIETKKDDDLKVEEGGGGLASMLDMAGGLGNLANMFNLGGDGATGDMMKGLTDLMSNPEKLMENMGLDMSKMQEAMESMVPPKQDSVDATSANGDDAQNTEGTSDATNSTSADASNPMSEMIRQLQGIGIDPNDQNPNFANVMSKVMGSGKLPELMKATTQMMANSGMGNIMQQMMGQQSAQDVREVAAQTGDKAQQNRVNNATRGMAARDRLRAKHAANQQKKQ
jgi:hypothetical protein